MPWGIMALTRQQAEYYAIKSRRKSRLDPSSALSRTHSYGPSDTGISVVTQFPNRTKPITVQFKLKVTGASPNGVVFELGSATTGLAVWVASNSKLMVAFGDSAADDGVTLTGPVLASGQNLDVCVAAIPTTGKARLWINGRLAAWGEAANAEFPNGWADTEAGAVSDVDGTVTTRVSVGDRIALTDAQVVSLVSVFQNQRPRQFHEVA